MSTNNALPILDSEDIVSSRHEANPILQTTQNITGSLNLPHIDPLEMIGFYFVDQHNNMEQKATIKVKGRCRFME